MRTPKNRLHDLEQKLQRRSVQKETSAEGKKHKPAQSASVEAMSFDNNEPIDLRYDQKADGYVPSSPTYATAHSLTPDLRSDAEAFEIEPFDEIHPVPPTPANTNSPSSTPVTPDSAGSPARAFEIDTPVVEKGVSVPDKKTTESEDFLENLQAISRGEKTYDGDRKQVIDTPTSAPKTETETAKVKAEPPLPPIQAEVVSPATSTPTKSAAPPAQAFEIDTPAVKRESSPPEEVVTEDDFLEDLQAILNGEKTYDGDRKQTVNTSTSAPNVEQLSVPPSPSPAPVEPLKQTSPHDVFDRMAQGVPPEPKAPTPTPTYSNAHSVFDRMGKNMAFANSFDLGTISLQQRFDEFDRILEAEESAFSASKLKAKKAKTELHSTPLEPATRVAGSETTKELQLSGSLALQDAVNVLGSYSQDKKNVDGNEKYLQGKSFLELLIAQIRSEEELKDIAGIARVYPEWLSIACLILDTKPLLSPQIGIIAHKLALKLTELKSGDNIEALLEAFRGFTEEARTAFTKLVRQIYKFYKIIEAYTFSVDENDWCSHYQCFLTELTDDEEVEELARCAEADQLLWISLDLLHSIADKKHALLLRIQKTLEALFCKERHYFRNETEIIDIVDQLFEDSSKNIPFMRELVDRVCIEFQEFVLSANKVCYESVNELLAPQFNAMLSERLEAEKSYQGAWGQPQYRDFIGRLALLNEFTILPPHIKVSLSQAWVAINEESEPFYSDIIAIVQELASPQEVPLTPNAFRARFEDFAKAVNGLMKKPAEEPVLFLRTFGAMDAYHGYPELSLLNKQLEPLIPLIKRLGRQKNKAPWFNRFVNEYASLRGLTNFVKKVPALSKETRPAFLSWLIKREIKEYFKQNPTLNRSMGLIGYDVSDVINVDRFHVGFDGVDVGGLHLHLDNLSKIHFGVVQGGSHIIPFVSNVVDHWKATLYDLPKLMKKQGVLYRLKEYGESHKLASSRVITAINAAIDSIDWSAARIGLQVTPLGLIIKPYILAKSIKNKLPDSVKKKFNLSDRYIRDAQALIDIADRIYSNEVKENSFEEKEMKLAMLTILYLANGLEDFVEIMTSPRSKAYEKIAKLMDQIQPTQGLLKEEGSTQ